MLYQSINHPETMTPYQVSNLYKDEISKSSRLSAEGFDDAARETVCFVLVNTNWLIIVCVVFH